MPESENALYSDYYQYFTRITTRWIDNDLYGHINNVNYYQFFDTVVNEFLIERGGLQIHTDDVVAYVVASSCQYRSPVAHPDIIHAGLTVNRLGTRSVEYGVGVFRGEWPGSESGAEAATLSASAFGTFTHVYVSRSQGGSVSIPEQTRSALEELNSLKQS